jgi:thiamine-monophosphate kinase
VGDIGHVLSRSGVGATLQAAALPRSPILAAQDARWQLECTLAGGDDYELLFTAPADAAERVHAAATAAGVAATCIGRIDAEPGLRVKDAAGRDLPVGRGFDHFRT